MTLEEMMADLPKACNVGSKKNSRGYKETWVGKADPPMLHVPYYKWPPLRKVACKTVNATLTPEQATRFKNWVQNMHMLDRIVRLLQGMGSNAATLLLQPIPMKRSLRPISNGTTTGLTICLMASPCDGAGSRRKFLCGEDPG
ncbi:MAG: DUF6788 family protein [Candidatus Ozemobacteraceae bacterium]